MIKTKTITLTLLFTFAGIFPSVNFASPKGHDQIRLQTGTPKRINETAFSSFVAWRREHANTNKDQTNVNKANGLTFINGSGDKKPTTDVQAARKIAKSLNGGISHEAPHDRGAAAEYNKNKAEVLISNNGGFNLTRVTFRDYTNQELHFNVPNKSFNAGQSGLN